MADPAKVLDQNLLPVQAYFAVDGTFQTFIGQGQPFYATLNPNQSGLAITLSTLDSSPIGSITPSTGVFTNISTTTGSISTTPSANTDIANKYYVDQIAQGLSPKQAVKCGTIANITLSGLQAIDSYTTLAGDRVLVKNQNTSSENGIYIASSTAWTRSTDMDVWSEVPGAYTVILNGSTNADTAWVTTAADTGTINVTAMPWVQFSGSGTYFAGTGLTLASNTFSITNTGVTAASVGAANKTLTATVNAQGQLTVLADTNIAIAGNQITSGTIGSSYLTGSYTGITGVGTLTAGTWNASTVTVPYGGTGATTLTGYVYGNGTGAMSAATTIPTTALSGTITNAQLANSTISGVSLGSNLFALTIGSGLSGTSYNGSAAVTITNSSPMVYPAAGIPSSTGTAWNTSYSTTGTGTVLALATGATLNNPLINNYEDWTATSSPSYVEGRAWYDSSNHALSIYNDVTNNIVHLGEEVQLKVINNTGSSIPNGSPVYITSTSSGQTYPNIALAKADTITTSNVIGLTNGAIANGAAGYVTTIGLLNPANTGAFTVGDVLYLSPYSAGQIMNTLPPTGYPVRLGIVAYANTPNGAIYITKTNVYSLASNIIGQVAIANGGTNGTATPTAGTVAYGTGTAYAFTAAGTSGQVLQSNGSSAPTWVAPSASVTISDDTSTISARYPLFASVTTGTTSTEYVSSTKLQYVPNTGVLTATGFAGAGTGLTGTASGLSIGGNAATATTATNIAAGAANQIPYQTGANATSFITAPTTSSTTLTWNGSAFTWAAAGSAITISDDTTTNSPRYPLFSSATSGTVTTEYVSSTKYKYNPSTGELTSPEHISSNGIGLNASTVSSNYTIATGTNGFSVGPVTVNSGITLTVSAGQRYVIV